MGNAVCGVDQATIGHRANREGFGGAGSLRVDQLMGTLRRDRRSGGIEFLKLSPLTRRQHLDSTQRGIGITDQRLEQHRQVSGEPLHRRPIEQIAAILQLAFQLRSTAPRRCITRSNGDVPVLKWGWSVPALSTSSDDESTT